MKQQTPLFLVYRILLVFAVLLALLLFGGTIYAIVFRQDVRSPISGLRGRPAGPQQAEPQAKDKVFPALGRLRITLADSATLVVSPVFPYDDGDIAFTEELALRIRVFKDITRDYFSPFKTEELQKKGEETVKTELLRLFNSVLRLGHIEILYFNDFIIIE